MTRLQAAPGRDHNTAGSGLPTRRSAFNYQVVDKMNGRTAEQGTAEYRSGKHCLILF